MRKTKRIVSLLLAVVMLLSSLTVLVGCGEDMVIDNESTRLVLSTSELDGVFNPFYYSSGPDGSIIGMTQMGMLSSDKYGKVAFGKNEACVVLDYDTVQNVDPVSGETVTTTYRFVLKNDLKFSDGSPLTMKDVLFNLYVYLDPAYYGSATIYSTDIVGLKEYRTQTTNESEQDGFSEQFDSLASERVARLLECLNEVYDKHSGSSVTSSTVMINDLTEIKNDLIAFDEAYATVVDDYALAEKYFREELETDYGYAKGTAEDIVFTDKNNNKVTLTTDTEAFFYNEGFITWNEKEYRFDYSLGEQSKDMTEEQAINAIFNYYFPAKVNEVISYWKTADDLHAYFSFLEQQKWFENIDPNEKVSNISGIVSVGHNTDRTSVTISRVDSATGETVTTDYAVATEYNEDGSVKNENEYEILEVTINEVDPKAIWNFGFSVAPMYYYSDADHIAAFDYEENFGVEFGSIEFMDSVIKDPDKIGVPVGAGPYKATTREGDASKVEAGTFKADNVVYFERNDHFLFDVKIKYVNYQVVPTNNMLASLYSGDVHFVEPACKQENVNDIESKKDEGFASTSVMTNGYGYIGINAEKVPCLEVRQAIMHAINTDYAVDYYFGYSHPITRPMTKASWAYPDEADEEGQYYAFDETGAICEKLVYDAGYRKNAQGIYQKGNDVLSYVFTIAGDSTDHPAYTSLKRAAEILNEHGFKIEVKTDINALRKLNNGDLTVWAAAWGAGVDPDMYQVYHIDSTAGSTANWGYRAIRKNNGGKYDRELEMVKDLSDIIDKARETLDEDRREQYYAQALDMVMELAVELPTYQRSDLFAYNTNIIDETTLTPASELTPYNGPMNRLWEVSLKETDNAGAAEGEQDDDNNIVTVIVIVAASVVVAAGAAAAVVIILKKKKSAEKSDAASFKEVDDADDEKKDT